MTRVTIDLDPALYEALRERAEREGKPVDAFVANVLAGAVKHDRPSAPRGLNWPARDLGQPAVDISDPEALWEFLDREWLEKLGYDARDD